MEVAEQLIGVRVRDLRQTRRLTLQQVAERADLSKSFISKVERGAVSISIAALSRLATGLGVPMGEIFDTAETGSDAIFVPRGQGTSLDKHSKLPYQYEVLVPRRGERVMQPIIISIDGRRTRFELRDHPGEQFIFVLDGHMQYICGNEEFRLGAGDSLYLNARKSHGPKLKRNQKVRYLCVQTSDSFPKRPRQAGP
jgi:transcriptional regulator with XRE-family HTH domain